MIEIKERISLVSVGAPMIPADTIIFKVRHHLLDCTAQDDPE
jgi:hypothetical protein